MQDEEENGTGLRFYLKQANRKLVARYAPPLENGRLEIGWLKQHLAASEFGALHFNEIALAELVRKCNAGGEPFELEIGEVRDGEFRLEISPDLMVVRLLLFPPQGGQPATKSQILDALRDKGIVSGVIEENIETAIQCGSAEGIDIAKGAPPVHGQDGKLSLLVSTASERKPALDEMGIANFRELGGVVTVKAGESLMRRIPPSEGVPGINVMGHIVPPKSGKTALFAPRLDGAVIAADDPDLLTSAIAGQPVVVDNGVTVEPVITVGNADISTGNLHFEGTIVIQKDVLAGMTIEASGDIQVGGTVEAATLIAGGNVRVGGGVIGRHDGQKSASGAISQVRCGGTFHARFVQNAHIEAGDSIYVDEAVMQSELMATRQIIVGKDESQKGCLIGGKANATLLVKAQTLGAPSHVKTLVEVGVNPHLHAELLRISKELELKAAGKDNVEKLLLFLRGNPQRGTPDVVAKAEKTHANILAEIQSLMGEQDDLLRHTSLAENAKVVASRVMHAGTRIQIGSRACEIEDDQEGVSYTLREGEIVRELIPRTGQARTVLK